MIKIRRTFKPISIILIAIIISACMLSNALINGSIAYAADYTADNGTINTDNLPSGVSMPTSIINTKSGWLKWADAAMKANNYDGVYGTLKM